MNKTYTFRLEFKDFISAHRLSNHAHFISNPRLIRTIAVFLLALTLVFFGMHFMSLLVSRSIAKWSLSSLIEYIRSYQDILMLALVVVGALLLMHLSTDFLIRFRIWLMLKRNPDVVLLERTIEITDTGIHYFTSEAESNIKWEFFSRVLENNKYFVLIKSPDNYVIIPKRVFVESADAEQFREYLRTRLDLVQVNV